MDVSAVHNRIRSLADERGYSVYELASRAKMPTTSLYNMFERGTMPKIDTLEKICNALDITMSDFFSFISKPQDRGYLTQGDMSLVEVNRCLTQRQQEKLLSFALGMQASNGGGA